MIIISYPDPWLSDETQMDDQMTVVMTDGRESRMVCATEEACLEISTNGNIGSVELR